MREVDESLRALERIPQLELDQARGADRAEDLPNDPAGKLTSFCNWVSEIRMVPDVEEIRREAEALLSLG